jgi:biopolymer transport protein ExbB
MARRFPIPAGFAVFLLVSTQVAFAAAGDAHELSIRDMVLNADPVVKAIMALLVAASVTTWTVFIAKTIEIGRARRKVLRSRAELVRIGTLARIASGEEFASVIARDCVAGARLELSLSDPQGPTAGKLDRVASRLKEIEATAMRHIRIGTGLLATIGSVGPFVGLFGTVWGIMNAFVGIAAAGSTSLTVVAPGIAEALLTTAMGLAAAIPAVVIYNHLARATARYLEAVHQTSGEVLRLVSRDLDRPGQARSLKLAAE